MTQVMLLEMKLLEKFLNNLLTCKLNNLENFEQICKNRPDEFRPRSKSFYRNENSLEIYQTVIKTKFFQTKKKMNLFKYFF